MADKKITKTTLKKIRDLLLTAKRGELLELLNKLIGDK